MLDKQAIGERILTIRKSKGLNQSAFAESIEISQQALSQIEKGKILPSLEVLSNLTIKYDKSYDYLLTGRNILQSGVVTTKEECRFCFDKDELIEAKNETISTQTQFIAQLQEYINHLKELYKNNGH